MLFEEKDKSVGTNCEVSGNRDLDKQLLQAFCNKATEKLKIGWKDRDTASNLLYSSLEDEFLHRGIIEKYFNLELKIIAETFCKRFNIKADVDARYATHAKFNSIIELIEGKIKEV